MEDPLWKKLWTSHKADYVIVVVVVVIVQTSSLLSCRWFRIVVNVTAVTETEQLLSEHLTYCVVRVGSPRGPNAHYGL